MVYFLEFRSAQKSTGSADPAADFRISSEVLNNIRFCLQDSYLATNPSDSYNPVGP